MSEKVVAPYGKLTVHTTIISCVKNNNIVFVNMNAPTCNLNQCFICMDVRKLDTRNKSKLLPTGTRQEPKLRSVKCT